MRLTKPLLWLITLLWFALGIWWYSSSSCTSCAAGTTASTETPSNLSNLPGFSVSDGAWNISSKNNLRFGKSGFNPVLGTDITTVMDSLVSYGKAHPNKKITVTGYYNATETNTSTFENLGLARAEELKKVLVSKGLKASNIFAESKKDESLIYSPIDTLVGGISMMIMDTVPLQPKLIAKEKVKEDLFAPRTVYFKTGENSLNVDADLKDYLEKANQYLKTHSSKTLLVTGHTDNVGDPARNVTLSANRAMFVKTELTKQGIAAASISTQGKGMADPIADNNTAEGKAKNRRVTIQIK
jgi:OmpA-OmpF porin, OOP family